MANGKQLEIIKRSVSEWNEWRNERSDIKPDLSKANLTRVDLNHANLSDTDFRGVNLSYSNLQGANFQRSSLVGANLLHANLKGADLSRSIFRKTYVERLDMSFTKLYETTFADIDLTNVEGLSNCIFRGPIIIDHRSLTKSHGIPEAFLRGCGLPDLMIDLYRSKYEAKYPSCFISYSTSDQDFADKLYENLQNNGVRCWFAPHHMKAGQKVHEQIESAINNHEKLLLVLSENSMKSEWVKSEIANARLREVNENTRILFPIRLVEFEKVKEWRCFDADTGKDSAREVREYHIPGFEKWENDELYSRSFNRLLNDLAFSNRS